MTATTNNGLASSRRKNKRYILKDIITLVTILSILGLVMYATTTVVMQYREDKKDAKAEINRQLKVEQEQESALQQINETYKVINKKQRQVESSMDRLNDIMDKTNQDLEELEQRTR